jgi:transposase
VAERLDYQPGVFSVERHVRGKWACRCCERIVQAPVPAHVIDKGLPTAGLLAHLLVAKFLDHLPLYRQEAIFERAGHLIARSTLAQWVGECGAQLQPLVNALADELRRHAVLHADETPVAMLKPKHLSDGKTHKAYIWSYCTTSFNATKAVVFQFTEGRSGENVQQFLKLDSPKAWQGTLVTDGFSGYTATTTKGVTSAQCMAHYPERCFIWCNGPPGQVLRGGSQSRSPHKIRRFRGTARRQEGPPWASTPWYSPARCLPSSRTPASHRASSAGWS